MNVEFNAIKPDDGILYIQICLFPLWIDINLSPVGSYPHINGT